MIKLKVSSKGCKYFNILGLFFIGCLLVLKPIQIFLQRFDFIIILYP